MNFKRMNFRRIAALVTFLVVLWIVVSLFEAPNKSLIAWKKGNMVELEHRIAKLQTRLESQISESGTLLSRAKQTLKQREQMQHDDTEERKSLEALPVEEPGKPFRGSSGPILPVLVISCDRVTVKRCLDNLVKFRPNKETFPIIVSQDCGHDETFNVIRSFVDRDPTIQVVRQPDLSEIPLPKSKIKFKGYYKIARHFRFALNYVLDKLEHEAVIIVEDDLDISPDFFEYFLGTYSLLLKDPTLWCISAWNDNGKKELTDSRHPELLHRTDFFPGLGWLLMRETWKQLEPNWPEAFFDDWLRDPVNTGGRACIRPEISRTFSFGKIGVSKGLFFDMHLRYIQLNKDFIEFTNMDLSYLIKDRYDLDLMNTISGLPEMTADEVMATRAPDGKPEKVKVFYSDAKSYRKAAKKLGLMDDFRSGIPRTAYRGIVTCFINGRRVYLTPSFQWTQYDPNWG